MLGKKTKRSKSKDKGINLTIPKEQKNYEFILNKLDKAEELYEQYNGEKSEKKRWEIIEKIVDSVEINPTYNFELLKLNKKYKKNIYKTNLMQLGPTLSKDDYYTLTGEAQKNPSLDLFNLLNLCLKKEKQFDIETKKIINNNYNIPLILGNERIRINYYIRLMANFEVFANDNQKKYLLDEKYKISEEDLKELNILKDKYKSIKNGIKFFKDIIPHMKDFFENINLEENNINIKIFTLMLYITDIYKRINNSMVKTDFVKNFFLKEIDATKDLLNNNSLDNILEKKKFKNFPKNYGIKKKYNNKDIKKQDKEKDKKMNEYVIFNEFESIDFDGRNYVIENLVEDYRDNAYIPLEILLLRNQSLSYFEKNNKNFLNVKENIYKEFKKYVKMFIKSQCIQDALNQDERYKNIIEVIKDDNIIDNFLNDKYLKSIPLFEFSGTGYTNKDLLIFCVTGFPCKISQFENPTNIEDYNILKGIFNLFNIGMKLITTLHEMIIHFFFGYLNYITYGDISHESPRKNSKFATKDGGLYFEQILFGKKFGSINLNEVLVILNGDCSKSLEEFQNNLKKDFDPKLFEVKSNFLKLILSEYSLDLNKLENNINVHSLMKSSENGIFIFRDEMNIILPYKAPVPPKKNKKDSQ